MVKGGIPFIRIENIKGGFRINPNNMVYISPMDNTKIANSQLFVDDIILSKVGNSIGFFARVDDNIKTCNISENNIGIKLSSYSTIEKHFILAFFNSKYGQILLTRRKSGNAQPKLNVDDVCYVPIPIFSNIIQKKIDFIILSSDNLYCEANKVYHSAESLLLSSLNLDNFTPSTENTCIKRFSQVDKSGRMDAEYYQVKYDEIEAHIKRKDYTRAYDLLAHNNSMYTPFPQKQYSYIELANIESYGNINDNCSIARGSELPTRARRQVEVDDVIISSIEGSLESCALIPKQYHHALCSTGFYILHSSVINAETLLVLFKSYPVQMLMKRGCNGTILTAISLEELKHVFIPIPEASVQKQVADKVRHSFYLREQSKSLLKAATRAVEIAIEQDESAAMAYLSEQTKGDA